MLTRSSTPYSALNMQCCLQGTVFWRARLPLQQVPDSPVAEKHWFLDDKASAIYYSINDSHCVWTIATPAQTVADAGLAPKPPKVGSATSQGSPPPANTNSIGTAPNGVIGTASNGVTAHSASNGKPCQDKRLAEQRTEAGQVILEVHS